MILNRGPKLCNFVERRGYKVVYKIYASLYLCMCIDQEDNELEVLEIIHHYVEILDRYFGNVSQLNKAPTLAQPLATFLDIVHTLASIFEHTDSHHCLKEKKNSKPLRLVARAAVTL